MRNEYKFERLALFESEAKDLLIFQFNIDREFV